MYAEAQSNDDNGSNGGNNGPNDGNGFDGNGNGEVYNQEEYI
jgi:hypothetical protein